MWNGEQPISPLSSQGSENLTFNFDPSAMAQGDYTLQVALLNNSGQRIAMQGSSLSITGPAFQITQVPPGQTLMPGEEATFAFKVKNTGNQEGAVEFHFKAYDLLDVTRREWLKAGEERSLDFAFLLPADLEEKDYFVDYELKGGERGQVKYHLAGINLAVSASLDKAFYSEGETARLSLSVSPSAGQPLLNLFARVNYPGYESKQPLALNGPQALLFDVPLPEITGEKLFYGIYHESGRSIYLNSLYVYKAGDVLTLKTDKQVYKPGETVVLMVSSQQMASGTLTLSAPNYEEAFSFSGNAQKSFVLPAAMTAGTYFITYQLSGPQSVSGSQPFDVDGIQVKVKKAILDKAKYASTDTMNLNLTIESNQDLPATLKTWIVDPEKNYSSAGTQGITLTGAQPLLAAQSSAFSTTKLGIHRLVYGIYKDEMLLCSGSYAFDVGEAILLGVSTDRADYPQGNEPIAVEAKVYGTVPGSLEFSLDGQSVGSVPVSTSGFSATQYTPPEISPGLHTLKASLTSGGLTSSKQITFVYGSSLPDLSVRVSSDPNIKDGFMTITITVTNQGKSASIPTTLGLYDGDKLLTILDVKGLQSGESQISTYSMNVLGRAGANSLVSRIDPGNKVFEFSKANNEANLSFAVPDLSLAVSLDKTVYGAGETAVITSSIYNLSKDPLPGLTLATEVKDAQGVQIFNKAQILPTLEGQNSAMIETLWLTDAGLKEGVYSVSQTVQGKVATQATVSVAIKDFAKGLEGTITVQPNPVNQESEETFSYTVTNKGSVDLSGLTVKALVINPDTGEVRKTYEKVVDLAQNGTISGNFSASTGGLAPGVYNAVLQVSSAVILTPKSLGSAIFEVKAAVPMISWAKTYGGDHNGVAYSIQQTLDGGYIAAGATGTLFPMSRDAWVRKLDGKGDIQWQKAYGSGLGDAAFAVQPTTDGGYVVAGETNGILGMSRECWVFKLDFNGEIQWQKTYGDGWARSIQQTSEGGYIVTGAREEQAWLMKLDEKGEIQWQKAYGSLGDGAYSVQQTADGGFVVAGVTGSERSPAAWVGKLDAQGEIQWQKTYGDHQGEVAYSIQQTTEGGYILAGVTNSSEEGNPDAWVFKIDAHGEIQWQKAYGGQQGDAAYSIHQTPDNGYIVVGVTNSFGNGDYDAWVLKLDADGEVEWQKAYGGQHGDAAFAIQQAKDGGYIAVGGTNSFGDHDYDVWMWKLDEKGEISTCQEGWRKGTNVTAKDATAVVKEGSMRGRNIHVRPKESHARVKEMQGWANDVCVGIPHISLDPSSRFLTFFGVKVGRSSTTTITVFNRGTGDLKIVSIKVSGAPFTQKNDCAVLPPGHSCAIAVTFKPTAPGPMNATLEIYSNDPDENIIRLNLLGTGR
ncbi:MAG: CARDB domain-containing protein [Thermodesulfobacteriota bacterium]